LLAEALKVQHALELIETQGSTALGKYFEKLEKDAARGQSKAVVNVIKDVNEVQLMLLPNSRELLFEIGKIFPVGGETISLAGAGLNTDFYEIKGIVEMLLEKIGLDDFYFADASAKALARADIRVGNTSIGHIDHNGWCFIIQADNIELDMNGSTITNDQDGYWGGIENFDGYNNYLV